MILSFRRFIYRKGRQDMDKKKQGPLDLIKTVSLFFIKVIYVLPFILFGIWLISVVYFHGFNLDRSRSVSTAKEVDDLSQILTRKKDVGE